MSRFAANRNTDSVGRRRRPSSRVIVGLTATALSVALLGACGSSGTRNAVTRGTGPDDATTAPPTTLPKKALPAFTDDPTVSCSFDSPLTFPGSVLTGPAGAENGPSDAAKTLKEDLSRASGSVLNNSGELTEWRLAKETPTEALFLGSGGNTTLAQLYEKKDGRWRWVKFSNCNSPTVYRPGLNVVAIDLDDAAPTSPTSTSVRLQVTELTCTGGVALTPQRVIGPQVHADDDRVVISVAAQPVPGKGTKTCTAAFPVELTVKLPGPLGDRQLLDGNRFPYKPIS